MSKEEELNSMATRLCDTIKKHMDIDDSERKEPFVLEMEEGTFEFDNIEDMFKVITAKIMHEESKLE